VILGVVPEAIEIVENGTRFLVNLYEGQKTGFYLDQRENREKVASYVKEGDRFLDVFCNAGGFGIYASQKGANASFVDLSSSALAQVQENLKLNNLGEKEVIKEDAFLFMTKLQNSNEKFDFIILDPPPFAKTKREARGAVKGMKFLLSSGLRSLKEGGHIAIFSCSFHVGMDELLNLSLNVSSENKVMLEIVEKMGASKDHPNILNIPNSAYLNGILLKKIVT